MEKKDFNKSAISEMSHEDWKELAELVEDAFHNLAPKGTSVTFIITDSDNARCIGGCFPMPGVIRVMADCMRVVTSVFQHNISNALDNKDAGALSRLTSSPMILIPIIKNTAVPMTHNEAEEAIKSLTEGGDDAFISPIPTTFVNVTPLPSSEGVFFKPKNKDIH